MVVFAIREEVLRKPQHLFFAARLYLL